MVQLYADDAYHNIGTPRNPEIPDSGVDPDLGLAGLTGVNGQNAAACAAPFNPSCDHRGFHKTPTMRNVNKRPVQGFTKAYTHNGWFKSMESIVHFYNTAFLGGPIPFPPFNIPYEDTTASTFGVTRCPPGIETEKDALESNCWPAPAYANPLQGGSPAFGAPIGGVTFGNLHLTLDEEAAIVEYLKTLTDEHTATAPKPYSPPRRR